MGDRSTEVSTPLRAEVNDEIRTRRLVLRRLQLADEDAVMAYRSDPRGSRFLRHKPMEPGEYPAWLAERSSEWDLKNPGDRRFYGIAVASSGTLIGDAVLKLASDGQQGEIGMFLHPETLGLGYSLEAGRVLIDVAFRDLGLHRLIGHADVRNRGSVRAMEALGLRREEYFIASELRDDEWVDTAQYALLRSEWEAKSRT